MNAKAAAARFIAHQIVKNTFVYKNIKKQWVHYSGFAHSIVCVQNHNHVTAVLTFSGTNYVLWYISRGIMDKDPPANS